MLDKSVIGRLRMFPWGGNYGIYYAVLFGSIVRRGGFGEDVDIAVEFVGGLDLGSTHGYSLTCLITWVRIGWI